MFKFSHINVIEGPLVLSNMSVKSPKDFLQVSCFGLLPVYYIYILGASNTLQGIGSSLKSIQIIKTKIMIIQ